MEWSKWKPKYEWIVKKLKLNRTEDERAAKILNRLINSSKLPDLKKLIEGNECIVFGAGPSLEKDLEKLDEAGWLNKVLISADGATSAVKRYRLPDVIVTDLDGDVEDQLDAWQKHSFLVVHAHGDNIQKVKEIVPRLTERVIGTIQVNKPTQLYNFGGFTDGDRAAFMAYELGAAKIILSGMDLGEEIGEYTGHTNKEVKKMKLEICENLLSWLSKEFGAKIVNVTSEGREIPQVPREDIVENQQVK